MKELKVFESFEEDIFFSTEFKHSATKFDPLDRTKCYHWEREKTLSVLYPQLIEAIEAEKKLNELLQDIEKKYDQLDLSDEKVMRCYMSEIHQRCFEHFKLVEKSLSCLDIRILGLGEYPLYTIPEFPYKSYLSIDKGKREKWACPIAEFEYNNVTRAGPLRLLRNSTLESLSNYVENPNYHLERLEKFVFTSFKLNNKAAEKIRAETVVSAKVPVEIFIDPQWSEGTLKKNLIDGVRLIRHEAQKKKKKPDNQQKYSEPSEYDPSRTLRVINTNLNLLGHYRLLELEKWSWPKVFDTFEQRENNKIMGRLDSVRPISYEHYRETIKKVFPSFKHTYIS